MAINRLRLSAPLIRGNVPEEHATEFTDALVSEVEREIEPLAARSEMEEAINRAVAPLLQAIQGLRQEFHDLRVETAEREARQDHRLLVIALAIVGVNITIVSAGVGIILAFN